MLILSSLLSEGSPIVLLDQPHRAGDPFHQGYELQLFFVAILSGSVTLSLAPGYRSFPSLRPCVGRVTTIFTSRNCVALQLNTSVHHGSSVSRHDLLHSTLGVIALRWGVEGFSPT